LHPFAQCFAARCLVRAGRRDGISVLIDLLELDHDHFAGVATDKVSAALLSARQFCARWARTGLWVDPSEWRRWHDGSPGIGPQTLPDPGLRW
jgi:hypothetical protein